MSLNLKKIQKELDDTFAKTTKEDFEIFCLFDEARANCPWKCKNDDEECVCMKEAKKIVIGK